MPRNTGIGRKHKSGTGTSSSHSQPAARQLSATKLPKSEAPATKMQRRRPPPIPWPEQRPVYTSAEQVAARGEMVRAAAEELKKALDLLDAAEERHAEHLKKSTATLERLRKLRAKEGERSKSWTEGWRATLDGLEKEEQRLEGEAQLRQDEMAVAQRVLAERQEDFEEARLGHQAWFEYRKALLEASMRELELQSDGSSPDISDSDSDEMLTLDELMQRCVVAFDAEATADAQHAGPA